MLTTAFLAAFLIYVPVLAHPGNTASDGCHYCRTNCSSWGVAWNERHCHGGVSIPSPIYTPTPVYTPEVTNSNDYKYEDIPFETKYEDDANLEIGKEVVKQAGVNGKRTITFKVTKTDGVETGRAKEKEEITLQPINKVVTRGTKQPEAVTAANENNKGQVAGEQINDPFAALMGFLIVIGLPTWIIWLVIRKLKKKV